MKLLRVNKCLANGRYTTWGNCGSWKRFNSIWLGWLLGSPAACTLCWKLMKADIFCCFPIVRASQWLVISLNPMSADTTPAWGAGSAPTWNKWHGYNITKLSCQVNTTCNARQSQHDSTPRTDKPRKSKEEWISHTVSRSWSILRRSDAGTEDAEASVLSEASPKASWSFPRSISKPC